MRQFFEKERGKKRLGFGSTEKIESIQARYRPLACFEVFRQTEVRRGFPIKKSHTVAKHLTLYADLVFGHIYRMGKHGIESSNALANVGKLTTEEKEVLDRLLYFGPIRAQTTHPFVARTLLDFGLINIKKGNQIHPLKILGSGLNFLVSFIKEDNGEESLSEDEDLFLHPSDAFPRFRDDHFELGRLLKTVSQPDPPMPLDQVEVGPDRIIKAINSLAGFKAKLKEIVYLPYYECRYLNERSEIRIKIHTPLRITESK
ncbi:MAG: hypothetical protein ABH950_08890 [Candidatus Altiarchaeota archaeon]